MFHDSYEWYHLKLNFHDLNKWCVLDMDGGIGHGWMTPGGAVIGIVGGGVTFGFF